MTEKEEIKGKQETKMTGNNRQKRGNLTNAGDKMTANERMERKEK